MTGVSAAPKIERRWEASESELREDGVPMSAMVEE
ncbi:hypothetical protein TIFTF001_055516, partial [Ficus carica]